MTRILTLIIIFLATSVMADEKLYVILDNSKNSQLLKFELTRDWTSGKRLCSELYALDNKRIELQPKIVLVDYNNPNEASKYRIPTITKFPSYRVGMYKEPVQYPLMAFETTSYPLLTTCVILNNSIVDEIQWKTDCEFITETAKSDWRTKVLEWAYSYNFNEAQKLFNPYIYTESDINNPFKEMAERHKLNKSFPKYIQPTLPKNPVLKYPFERE